jgi:predicted dithiol-disulfide oxidoreductase (DUF899 family)
MTHPLKRSALPPIVSPAEWQAAHEKLLAKEKAATHARDALAAERRRQPMMRIEKSYVFEEPGGKPSQLDLFEGRTQLLLYHFMFAPGVNGWPDAGCPGCSLFTDQVGNLSHLRARDTSMAWVSLAPLENIERYRKRMGWDIRWASSAGNTFNRDLGLSTDEGENHGLSVFIRDDQNNIYRSYFSSQRGLEMLGSVWSFLDLTPLGRQETWEDTPPGRPQSAPYQWWKRHDMY